MTACTTGQVRLLVVDKVTLLSCEEGENVKEREQRGTNKKSEN